MISLDTETTGVDLKYGARPFFVTTCQQDGRQQYWEWDVDPLTRQPIIPDGDREMIGDMLFGPVGDDGPDMVLQNCKFDVGALQTVLGRFEWPWHKTVDTLVAGHVLASNAPHDLTSMALHYLGEDIVSYEHAVEEAVKKARRYCQHHRRHWKIAKFDEEGMPSCPRAKRNTSSRGEDKDASWRYDYWLPKALLQDVGADKLARHFEHSVDHWDTVLAEYANTDSAITLALWGVMEQELYRRSLYAIFQQQMKVVPVTFKIWDGGLTGSKSGSEALVKEFKAEVAERQSTCVNIAESFNYPLEMPTSASPNGSLRTFVFDVMNLEPIVSAKSKTGNGSLDKEALKYYVNTLDPRDKRRLFCLSLLEKRGYDTALSYLDGYTRFWIDYSPEEWLSDYFVIHPNMNQTGTDTLRFSCSSPNAQNISKQERANLRKAFGPAPGREWFCLDARNIERRIPAFEADETDIINLFERPDDPPYFGSEHSLVGHIIWSEEFEQCLSCGKCDREIHHPRFAKKNGKYCECSAKEIRLDGRIFKKRYGATLYQWTKNGNFAIQYGAQKRKADATYHRPGAFELVKMRFHKQEALNTHWVRHAEKYGYVETIPDKTVDPKRGYPLLCTRTEWGKILPTVPLNYHTSGTAMQWMRKAMVRTQDQLDQWNRETGFDGRIAIQVHDELVFDLPKAGDPVEESRSGSLFRTSNLWRIKKLQHLMEMGGDDIDIPTPVGIEYCPHHWAEGLTI